MQFRERLPVLAITLLACVWLLPARAADAPHASPESLGSFHHTAFLRKDGAPGDVSSVERTADGFMWLAGTRGATRFDGMRFDEFTPPPGEHYAQPQLNRVYPASDGGLWLINDTHGPTLLKDGHLVDKGVVAGYVGLRGRMFAGPDGKEWAVNTDAVMRYDGQQWQVFAQATKEGIFHDAIFDSHGNLWVIRGTVLEVARGARGPLVPAKGAPAGVRRLGAGPSGRLYLRRPTDVAIYRDNGRSMHEVAQPVSGYANEARESPSGALWLTSPTRGVLYASAEAMAKAERDNTPPAVEAFTKADGLSGTYPWPIWFDEDGGTWVGTDAGIDRFRRAAFTSIRLPEGIHEVSAAVSGNGTIWVGSETMPVLRIDPDGSMTKTNVPKEALGMAFDPVSQTAFAATPRGIWQITPGNAVLVAPHSDDGGAFINCVARDLQGRIIACLAHPAYGLAQWNGNTWENLFNGPLRVRSVAIGPDNALWAPTTSRNQLFVARDGSNTEYGEREGLAAGTVKAVLPVGAQAWIGGDAGLQYFDGKTFFTLEATAPDVFVPSTGVVLDKQGSLWVQTLQGVVRVKRDDVQRFLADHSTRVPFQLYTSEDGIPGSPDPDRTLPTLRLSEDGRIWAQTTTGLAWILPDAQLTVPSQLHLVVESVASESAEHSAREAVELQPGEQTFRVTYTTPYLTAPDAVRFSYRLVGYNDEWQDAGTRREAVFTKVPPGSYRFELRANAPRAIDAPMVTISIERRPAVHETWWFRALGIVPVLLVIWVVFHLRTRRLEEKHRIRSAEREAVARDIHDTLLQRLHGLLISLQSLAGDGALPRRAHDDVVRMTDTARQAIVEARRKLIALRQRGDQRLDLYDALSREGRSLQEGTDIGFSVKLAGGEAVIADDHAEELRDMATEVLRNAFHHAKASRVEVTINVDNHVLWLVVADDGAGFSKADVERAMVDGHFGLKGVRERGDHIGAHVHIDTEPGHGTEVHIRHALRSNDAATPAPARSLLQRFFPWQHR
ncbi:signal transduction histidine kinase/ligand-binding sensor domain-containing protein [Luteibacter sp. 621]